MPKKRKKTSKKRPKKKSPRGRVQWIVVLIIAIGLYGGLNYLLKRSSPPSSKSTHKEKQKVSKENPWAPNRLLKLLPKDAVENYFEAFPLKDKQRALFAYAKKIKGKTPGPRGVINTRPALSLVDTEGKTTMISFKTLEPAIGAALIKRLMGPPQVEKNSLKLNGGELFTLRLFLAQSNQKVTAYLWVDQKAAHWATLHHASGKKMPAAFVTGTSEKHSQEVKLKIIKDKPYLILKHGTFNELKPHEGYRWKTQAYAWNKDKFFYDPGYSPKK